MVTQEDIRLKYWLMLARLGKRIWRLPPWMQQLLIQDIEAAIQNRLAVFEGEAEKCVNA